MKLLQEFDYCQPKNFFEWERIFHLAKYEHDYEIFEEIEKIVWEDYPYILFMDGDYYGKDYMMLVPTNVGEDNHEINPLSVNTFIARIQGQYDECEFTEREKHKVRSNKFTEGGRLKHPFE